MIFLAKDELKMLQDNWILLALFVMNILQFFFWSRQNQRLVDKVMSKNYADYVQSHAIAQPSDVVVHQAEDLKIEDADVLRELNRALPF